MIISCEASISRNLDRVKFSSAKIGIGLNTKNNEYYWIIVRNKNVDKFPLKKAKNLNFSENAMKIITIDNTIISLRDIDELTLKTFKHYVMKIMSNKKPLPFVPSIETIMKAKILPQNATITEHIQLKKLNNPLLNDVKLLNLQSLKSEHLIGLWKLKKLTTLSIENCNLKKIPYSLIELKNLRHLNMNHNDINEIPMWFTKEMQQLLTLNLSNNQIHSIPYEIIKLNKCHSFDFSHNHIKHFPSSLIHFYNEDNLYRRYTKIDFSYNQIKLFPKNLFAYSQYFYINCDNQSISEEINIKNRERVRFLGNTLMEKCLDYCFNNAELCEKLFDHQITPIHIYEYLQKIIFVCIECKKFRLRIGKYSSYHPNYSLITNRNNWTYQIYCKNCYDKVFIIIHI